MNRKRLQTLVKTEIRSLYRNPLTIGLMVLLPPYFINVMAHLMPEESVTVEIGGKLVTTTLDQLFMLRVGTVTTAMVAGIAGLFLIQQSREIDERAFVTGYTQIETVVARGTLLTGVVIGTVTVAVVALQFHATPDNWAVFVTGMILTGLIYGLLGFVTGMLLGEMGGVYTMLLVPGLDLMLVQNPLTDFSADVVKLFPGYYPMQLVEHASWGIDVTASTYTEAVVVLAITGTAGTLTFLLAHRH